jgi:hypothetical protein
MIRLRALDASHAMLSVCIRTYIHVDEARRETMLGSGGYDCGEGSLALESD